MAYFSNGSEGECFDEQCGLCKYGQKSCPIAFVQMDFNYDACNNEIARKILDHLVRQDGTCAMKEMAGDDFVVQEDNFNKIWNSEPRSPENCDKSKPNEWRW